MRAMGIATTIKSGGTPRSAANGSKTKAIGLSAKQGGKTATNVASKKSLATSLKSGPSLAPSPISTRAPSGALKQASGKPAVGTSSLRKSPKNVAGNMGRTKGGVAGNISEDTHGWLSSDEISQRKSDNAGARNNIFGGKTIKPASPGIFSDGAKKQVSFSASTTSTSLDPFQTKTSVAPVQNVLSASQTPVGSDPFQTKTSVAPVQNVLSASQTPVGSDPFQTKTSVAPVQNVLSASQAPVGSNPFQAKSGFSGLNPPTTKGTPISSAGMQDSALLTIPAVSELAANNTSAVASASGLSNKGPGTVTTTNSDSGSEYNPNDMDDSLYITDDEDDDDSNDGEMLQHLQEELSSDDDEDNFYMDNMDHETGSGSNSTGAVVSNGSSAELKKLSERNEQAHGARTLGTTRRLSSQDLLGGDVKNVAISSVASQSGGSSGGTCLDMCPEEERTRRQHENDVHKIEQHMGVMIKKLQRSSADHDLQIPVSILTVIVY